MRLRRRNYWRLVSRNFRKTKSQFRRAGPWNHWSLRGAKRF